MELFSGIGGFGLALQNQGHEVVGACEIDEYARRIYTKHFPNVRIFSDATKIKPEELPEFELLCAGFPCQAFSVAGKQRGFDDTRGTLFFEIIRIARERKPPYLLLENVKGLLSHEKGETLHIILTALDEIGYDVEWQIINSKYYVPQNRERIFIIGHFRGKRTRKIFPIGEINEESDGKGLCQIGNIDTKGNNSIWGRVYDTKGIAVTLRSDVGGLGAKTGLYAVVNDKGSFRDVDKATAIDSNYWKGVDNHAQRTMVKIVADRSRNQAELGRNLESPKDIANFLTSVTKDNLVAEFGITEKDGRKISNAVRTGGRGSFERHSWDIVDDGVRIRKLTPKECERLQGFPDNWTEGISDTQRYKCVGNAVTVPVVEDIVSRMKIDL